jgi:hypothetical protein
VQPRIGRTQSCSEANVSNAFIDKLKGYSALSVDDVRLLEAACSSNREEGFANAIERIIFGGVEHVAAHFYSDVLYVELDYAPGAHWPSPSAGPWVRCSAEINRTHCRHWCPMCSERQMIDDLLGLHHLPGMRGGPRRAGFWIRFVKCADASAAL